MRSIGAFDGYFPVRTVFSDNTDWKNSAEWLEAGTRNALLQSYVGVPVKRVFYAQETHSGSVFAVSREAPEGRLECIEERHIIKHSGGYDSLVTNVEGVMLCIWTADCLPLFLYDTQKHVAAMVHGGWRGICSGIVANTFSVMGRCYGTQPQHVLAAFGPCISGSRYEVGAELVDLFSERFSKSERQLFFKPKKDGKYCLDIKEAAMAELIRAGVKREYIYDTGICTYTAREYASYRRDGRMEKEKEMLSGIVLCRRQMQQG